MVINIEEFEGVSLHDWSKMVTVIDRNVPFEAMYEQLAEEAAELAQAALKVSRTIRGENPTPMTQRQAHENVVEELADLAVVCEVIGLEPDKSIMLKKMQRWADRLKGGGKNGVG